MRCNSCGENAPDDDAVFDTTNVPTGPGGRNAYTKTAPIWLCKNCAAYRRGTFRILFWIFGSVLAIGAIGIIIDVLF